MSKWSTDLSDIEIVLQTEIPISKQNLSSILYAVKGEECYEEIWDIYDRRLLSKSCLCSSNASTLAHGYAVFVNFFPGFRTIISGIYENVVERHLGKAQNGEALVFDDQYISSAGQIYLLCTGKYRLVVDLRSELESIQRRKGEGLSLCAHPYDLATHIIADKSGCMITDLYGKQLAYPLDTTTSCGWIGYANKQIKEALEPVLMEELQKLRMS